MNALQTTENNALETVNLPVDIAWPDLQAAIAGNLQKLSAEGQVKYYNALCKFTGLNPLGFPFEWITFQGKLKLYPKKECADQLRGIHKITAEIIERVFLEDIYMVRVKSTMPDGRHFESTGAVPYLKGMPALEKCKAIKVAETQAYRRGTFGLVGLGNLPDEDSEAGEATAAQVVVDAGQESVSSRAALLNDAIETGKVIDLKPEPTNAEMQRAQSSAESKPISQEPPLKTMETQPLVAATAPVSESGQRAAAPVVSDANIPSEPPDDFPDESVNDAGQKLADELELVFSEYQQPRECVAYVISQGTNSFKTLDKGARLSSINPVYAKRILGNPKGFLRAVESWVKGGRK